MEEGRKGRSGLVCEVRVQLKWPGQTFDRIV